ncbi:alkane 1-monooxygenase [Marinobacteraceae bacterium S3BR75-40.1]
MLEKLHPQTMLAFKKYAYLLFALPLAFPVLTYWMAQAWGWQNFFAWGTVIFVFGIVPLLDAILGKDPANPDEETQVPQLSGERYYRILTLACVPAYAALLVWGALVFMEDNLSIIGKLGWLMSIGTVGGLGIAVAHELIHKDEKLEQWAGGLLLSMVSYAGFKIEHIRGHHVHVSTPEDASSARYNQSLYEFLPHAYKHNFLNAWKLEKQKLERKKQPFISRHNELIWWYGITLGLLAAFSLAFGWMGALFFVGQSFFAMTLLEIVNYLEHYGLHRRKLENGRYERTMPEHSWNSNYFLTNIILFHLQRHSDHHAYAKRRYQVLRHHDSAPQLPAGYATMVLLALVPPLWKRVMNPRVEAYYQGEEHQLAS